MCSTFHLYSQISLYSNQISISNRKACEVSSSAKPSNSFQQLDFIDCGRSFRKFKECNWSWMSIVQSKVSTKFFALRFRWISQSSLWFKFKERCTSQQLQFFDGSFLNGENLILNFSYKLNINLYTAEEV